MRLSLRSFALVATVAIACGVSAAEHQTCVDYANQAVAANKELQALSCSEKKPVPGRFSNNFDGHYQWCRTVRNSTLDSENVARQRVLDGCRLCQSYAGGAVAMAKRYFANRCGPQSDRWSTNFEGHRQWCFGVRRSTLQDEDNKRDKELDSCIDRNQKAAAARKSGGAGAPACQPLQTNTECKGVVLSCDDGFYTQRTNVPEWHSCGKYVCGACLGWWSDWKEPVIGTAKGLSPLNVPSLPRTARSPQLPYGPDTCKAGYVWREAVDKDHVCVTPESRQQARTDNAQRVNRVSKTDRTYGPDTCIQGYTWREVVPSDHVCVLPQVRERTRGENAQVERNRVRGSGW